MSTEQGLTDATPTMSVDRFWDWVCAHPNCILRAGTREVVVFDDEDLHWHLAREGSETLLVQLIRGKRLVGEILIPHERIAYVQGGLGDQQGEYLFELVIGPEASEPAYYFFVLTHGFETAEELDSRRVH
jgi:hypothetical protein